MKEAEEIVESMDMTNMDGEGDEVMVQLRLFYLGVVHSSKNRVTQRVLLGEYFCKWRGKGWR